MSSLAATNAVEELGKLITIRSHYEKCLQAEERVLTRRDQERDTLIRDLLQRLHQTPEQAKAEKECYIARKTALKAEIAALDSALPLQLTVRNLPEMRIQRLLTRVDPTGKSSVYAALDLDLLAIKEVFLHSRSLAPMVLQRQAAVNRAARRVAAARRFVPALSIHGPAARQLERCLRAGAVAIHTSAEEQTDTLVTIITAVKPVPEVNPRSGLDPELDRVITDMGLPPPPPPPPPRSRSQGARLSPDLYTNHVPIVALKGQEVSSQAFDQVICEQLRLQSLIEAAERVASNRMDKIECLLTQLDATNDRCKKLEEQILKLERCNTESLRKQALDIIHAACPTARSLTCTPAPAPAPAPAAAPAPAPAAAAGAHLLIAGLA